MRSAKEKIRSRQRLECKRFRLPYSLDIFGEVGSDFHQAQRAGIVISHGVDHKFFIAAAHIRQVVK